MDHDSALQDKWIEEYRARWAAHRAAASVSTGDGGAWLEGDAARQVVCDAMTVPVVTGNIDPSAIEDLIAACVRYHRVRAEATADHAGGAAGTIVPAGPADGAAAAEQVAGTEQSPEADRVAHLLAMLEHQILANVLQVVSGPGGVASFLRRNLLGKGLNGPSLPLDVGQTDDVPVHLRRLVALRDQTCQFPGGCDQPAASCEPHHVVHRADGGCTSLTGLKNYCWWHHVMLHQMGWADRAPGWHQPGPQPRREDHPQPQPARVRDRKNQVWAAVIALCRSFSTSRRAIASVMVPVPGDGLVLGPALARPPRPHRFTLPRKPHLIFG
ncbi:MAG TPA: HNH endonuclease signature motif containing protein [Streptosporangiaceae bacterium]